MSLASVEAQGFELTPFQEQVLAVPESFDLALLGGRAGGKTTALLALILRHVVAHAAARCLLIRQTHSGLLDVESSSRLLFFQAFGDGATFNAHSGIWRFPNGSTLELGMMGDEAAFQKYQGRSLTLIAIDEAQQWQEPKLLDLLRSCLRGPAGVPRRFALAANPGGIGHHWLRRRFASATVRDFEPLEEPETGSTWVRCSSVLSDNPHVDSQEYEKQLQAATSGDPELRRAWIEGDWSIARGSFFGDVLSEARSLFEPWDEPTVREARKIAADPSLAGWQIRRDYPWTSWSWWLAHDYGSSAPSITYVCVRSEGGKGPDDRYYPRGSILLLDELALCESDISRGLRLTVGEQALQIVALAERWGLPAAGVADDAIFSQHGHGTGSIADEFQRAGVRWEPAGKGDRRSGWEVMRRLLADAGKPDCPGLYVSRHCSYFWETVAFLPRDPRRPDDVQTTAPDHGADACRYALVARADGEQVSASFGGLR